MKTYYCVTAVKAKGKIRSPGEVIELSKKDAADLLKAGVIVERTPGEVGDDGIIEGELGEGTGDEGTGDEGTGEDDLGL